jgi:hypothetical protein
MDQTTFDTLFDQACKNAILESYSRIQVPSPSVIQASWNVVLQRLEEQQTPKSCQQ